MESNNRTDTVVREFIITSQAWYAGTTLSADQLAKGEDEIYFNAYPAHGDGPFGELYFRWYSRGNGFPPAPRLEVYDDAWGAFPLLSDLLAKMADVRDQDISPLQMAELLKSLGFVDKTERVNPRAASPAHQAVEGRAELLASYQRHLDEVRKLGRKQSGMPDWAVGVENGEQFVWQSVVSEEVADEVLRLSRVIPKKRQKLREALIAAGDVHLAAKYEEILPGVTTAVLQNMAE